jgi:LemA protein
MANGTVRGTRLHCYQQKPFQKGFPMSTFALAAILIVPALLVVSLVIVYNRIVRYEQSVRSARNSIGVELKKRSDLIPQAIRTVKGYVAHESRTLAELTELRAQAQRLAEGSPERVRLEETFFSRFNALAEAYPQLQAHRSFVTLMRILERTEKSLAAARHIHNSNVDWYNAYIGSFPASIIAEANGFKPAEYLPYDMEAAPVEVPTDFAATDTQV